MITVGFTVPQDATCSFEQVVLALSPRGLGGVPASAIHKAQIPKLYPKP